MSEKLVSVIIPTYNRAAQVVEAIGSALAQTYASTEIIVVDDGSTDDTAKRVRGIPGVEYHRRKHRGQAAARNFGLSRARGAYIASLDSDDLWDPGFLAESVRSLEAHDLDLVFSNYRKRSGSDSLPSDWEGSGTWRKFVSSWEGEWAVLDGESARGLFLRMCPAPSSSLLLRREAVPYGWDERVKIADDWFLALEAVLAMPCRAAFTLEPRWTKRVDGSNIYDGQSLERTAESLGVHDGTLMLSHFGPRLSWRERRVLRGRVAFARFFLAYKRWKRGGAALPVATTAAANFAVDPIGIGRILFPLAARRLRDAAHDALRLARVPVDHRARPRA